MIDRDSIKKYFDKEAETAKANWDKLMALPDKDRVRKRRAITSVYLDKVFEKVSENGYALRRVSLSSNLSDFKEGDALLLHKSGASFGIPCTLFDISDDSAIIEVYPPNLPSEISGYYEGPLCLDRNCVDLRDNVYNHFIWEAPDDDTYWREMVVNTRKAPVFEDEDKNRLELEETVESFQLKLLPRQEEAILKSMSARDYYLIQGPPGTGKSFVLSVIILEELAYFNHKVAIIGPNHMAINNAMEQVLRLYPSTWSIMGKIGQSYNSPREKVLYKEEECGITNILYLNVGEANELKPPVLYGLTPHSLYTRRARGLEFDTLIIDEAGQMTVPLALMGMIKCKKVILAGDHKQLAPIVPETIEGDLSRSVFESLLTDDNCTMLDTSFRMCEPICNFVSKLFYDGKVKPIKNGYSERLICDSPLYSFSCPVVFHDVDDDGMQVSDKEAEFIVDTIKGFLDHGLDAKDMAVLSPFRAQAANIRRRIKKIEGYPEEDLALIKSDTVDKMQGQEREVIFYSITAGDPDYVSEMADFIANPNRLNVAFSRAKSKLIIVGNFARLKELDMEAYPHIGRMLEVKEPVFQ